jgi:uncharacterized DUF497 family protein
LFDWDDENRSHIARHDVTPEEAEQVLLNDPIDGGTQDHEGEERFVEVGMTDAMRILVVITTQRGESCFTCFSTVLRVGEGNSK